MSTFNFKKHLRKQILIREGWEEERDRQEKEEVAGVKDKIWGIDSDDPYAAPLNKMLPGDMDEKHKKRLAELILSLAAASGVKLEEEINLIGLRSERDRVINSDKIVALLYEFQKENSEYYSDENLLELAKILNQWGRLNSIKFVTQPRQATAPEEIEEPAPEKEKYRMSLASLGKTLDNIIDPKIKNKEAWIKKIQAAIKKDIPDMRLDEARDPVSFSNTLNALSVLGRVYKKRGLDFKPFERVVYDFLKVNNLEADVEAKPELHSAPEEAPEEEEEEEEDRERSETEEVSKLAAGDEEEDEDEESALTKALDTVQAGLDVAGAVGMFPPLAVIAAPAGIASLVLNLSRGKFGWALFDLITLVPVVGGAAKAGKLGRAAKAGAVAGKWKTGRALIKALGSADKVRKGLDAANAASAAIDLAQATKGATHLIGEMIPDEQWNKIVNAKIPEKIADRLPAEDRNKPFVDWVLDYLADADIPFIPLFDDKVEGLRDAWDEAKKVKNNKLASHPDDGNDEASLPPLKQKTPEEGGSYDGLRENLNLNERKYIMLLERFKIK